MKLEKIDKPVVITNVAFPMILVVDRINQLIDAVQLIADQVEHLSRTIDEHLVILDSGADL